MISNYRGLLRAVLLTCLPVLVTSLFFSAGLAHAAPDSTPISSPSMTRSPTPSSSPSLTVEVATTAVPSISPTNTKGPVPQSANPQMAPETSISSVSTFSSNQTYRVNSEITPGIYYSSNNTSTYCSWTRLKDFTGSYSQNGSDIGKGQQIVEIKSTDVGFDSNGCGTWKLVSTLGVNQLSTFTGEGTYSIAKQIRPGIYYSSNNTSTYCSWTRLKDFTGSYSQNGSDIGKGQQIVEIKSTDVGFDSNGCGTWKPISALATSPLKTISGEGVYSVSKQIVPGTYKSSNSSSTYCSWTRLKDFTGGYIQNGSGIGLGQRMAQITSSDLGFESSGCGTWTRVSG